MNNNYNYDIVFCSLPPLGMDRIYSAPAILKGIAEEAGYRARCFDFSGDFFHVCCKGNVDVSSRLSNYFIVPGAEIDSDEINQIEEFYDYIIDTVISANARYIGFSVFSVYTHRIAIDLLRRFEKLGMTDRIVLGGRGISCFPASTAISLLDITGSEVKTDLVYILKDRGLVKHYVIGDAEDALLEFLATGTSESKQNKRDNLDITWPDYSDYDFDRYQWPDNVQSLDVIGSTGCVRDCDFCDIKKQFGRYRFKDGVAFAEELIALQEKFKINKFVMADSLSNGGLKIFKQFINRLIQHNAVAPIPITWTGQYICREMQNMPDIDQYYDSIVKSGGHGLTIGAESGSNYVLDHMDKKTTVEALFFELDYFKRYGISCTLLSFVGHWSERHEDFMDHCDMIIKLIPYIRSGTISGMLLGIPYNLLPGTPADYNINIHQQHDLGMFGWIARNNRGNTSKVRLQRRLILSKLCDELDMSVELEETSLLQSVYESARANLDGLNKFFDINAQGDTSQFDPIADVDQVVESILNSKKSLTVQLGVEANACVTNPNLVVKINDTTIVERCLDQGEHLIEFEVPVIDLHKLNCLSLQMTNKGTNDTEVDVDGNILRDKNIIIKSLVIDRCDLLLDVEFFHKHFYYNNNGEKTQSSPGMWNNQALCLDFKMPFVQWYSNTTDRNKSNPQSLQSQQQVRGLLPRKDYYVKFAQLISQMPI